MVSETTVPQLRYHLWTGNAGEIEGYIVYRPDGTAFKMTQE